MAYPVFLLSRWPFDDGIEIDKDPISIFISPYIDSKKRKFVNVEVFFSKRNHNKLRLEVPKLLKVITVNEHNTVMDSKTKKI